MLGKGGRDDLGGGGRVGERRRGSWRDLELLCALVGGGVLATLTGGFGECSGWGC